MLSNLDLIDNPKVRELAWKMKDLPHVVDIRFFPTLRDDLKELTGETGVIYTAIAFKDNKWRRAFVIASEEYWSDDTKHQIVVDRMIAKLDEMIAAEVSAAIPLTDSAVIVP
jgi:hypothetical protein